MFRNLLSVACVLTASICSVFSEERNESLHVSNRPESAAFFELPLTEENKAFLRETIRNFESKSLQEIMQNREGADRFSNKFDSIHPLRFAGFVFSDPDLRQSAQNIMSTEGKSHLIVSMLMVKIKKGIESGTLNQYMPGFSDYCGADESIIHDFVVQDNYRGLIDYLIQL